MLHKIGETHRISYIDYWMQLLVEYSFTLTSHQLACSSSNYGAVAAGPAETSITLDRAASVLLLLTMSRVSVRVNGISFKIIKCKKHCRILTDNERRPCRRGGRGRGREAAVKQEDGHWRRGGAGGNRTRCRRRSSTRTDQESEQS